MFAPPGKEVAQHPEHDFGHFSSSIKHWVSHNPQDSPSKVEVSNYNPTQGWGGFPGISVGEESACNVGDPGLTPGSGRSAGEGKGYPFQYSGLENSRDCIVPGVAKNWTQFTLHFTSRTRRWHFNYNMWLFNLKNLNGLCFLTIQKRK